jgi:Ca2+-binding EF-hand superfamily protein
LNDLENKIEELNALLADRKEDLFITKQDLERIRVENIALKNFIQTLYESCDGVEIDEITIEAILENLKQNIRTFARDHNIRL